ncbi:MAG: DUF423 domain-containing protein [Planctomycetota bacterium]
MKPSPIQLFRAGCALGALGVAFGAFGAHALEGQLEPKDLRTYEKAVLYQFVHAIALAGLGLALRFSEGGNGTGPGLRARARLRLGGGILLFGTIVFCTSLYVVAFGTKIAGAVAPIGGTAFLVGWLILALAPLASDDVESDPPV